MGFDFTKVRHVKDGEVFAEEVLKRPIEDLILELETGIQGEVEDRIDAYLDTAIEPVVQTLIVDKADKSTNINSGNGLVGGGTLDGDVTISVGLPSQITGDGANSTTATSHTHSIKKTSARNLNDTDTLLDAKAMRDHSLSGDHDSRYVLKDTLPIFHVRAWGHYNGATNILLAGGNCTVTRLSSGRFRVNFITPMPDSNYAVTLGNAQSRESAGSNPDGHNCHTFNPTSFIIETGNTGTTFGHNNQLICFMVVR